MNYADKAMNDLRRLLPDCDDTLLRLYSLLVLTRGRRTTLKDVHDAWALNRTKTNSLHKSLVPFRQLDRKTQLLDKKYRDAIRKVARGYERWQEDE